MQLGRPKGRRIRSGMRPGHQKPDAAESVTYFQGMEWPERLVPIVVLPGACCGLDFVARIRQVRQMCNTRCWCISAIRAYILWCADGVPGGFAAGRAMRNTFLGGHCCGSATMRGLGREWTASSASGSAGLASGVVYRHSRESQVGLLCNLQTEYRGSCSILS